MKFKADLMALTRIKNYINGRDGSKFNARYQMIWYFEMKFCG